MRRDNKTIEYFKEEITKFLQDDKVCLCWVRFRGNELYIRKSDPNKAFKDWEGIHGQKLPYRHIKILELARVDIATHLQGHGYFTAIREMMENLAETYKYDGVLVEMVMNPILPPTLLRHGYKELNPGLKEKTYMRVLNQGDA
jgi:hypothetical protein